MKRNADIYCPGLNVWSLSREGSRSGFTWLLDRLIEPLTLEGEEEAFPSKAAFRGQINQM